MLTTSNECWYNNLSSDGTKNRFLTIKLFKNSKWVLEIMKFDIKGNWYLSGLMGEGGFSIWGT